MNWGTCRGPCGSEDRPPAATWAVVRGRPRLAEPRTHARQHLSVPFQGLIRGQPLPCGKAVPGLLRVVPMLKRMPQRPHCMQKAANAIPNQFPQAGRSGATCTTPEAIALNVEIGCTSNLLTSNCTPMRPVLPTLFSLGSHPTCHTRSFPRDMDNRRSRAADPRHRRSASK